MMNVLSNQAECYLRLQDYNAAAQAATDALVFDGDHIKSRIRLRLAKAELVLYKKKISFTYLAQAGNDLQVLLNDPGADTSKVAIESAEKLLAEMNECMKVEKLKLPKEPGSDFD